MRASDGCGGLGTKEQSSLSFPREQGMLRDISIINKNFGKKGRKNYEICNENQGRKSKSLKKSRHDCTWDRDN